MKRSTKILVPTIIAVGVLSACGDDEVTTAPPTAPTEDQATTTDAPFNFSSFSLDLDYEGNDSIEIDYENDSSGVEASYENELTKETLTGDDAFAKFSPVFESLTFDQSTADQAVIEQVVSAFGFDNNYKELDLEVRFADGTEKEYKVKQ